MNGGAPELAAPHSGRYGPRFGERLPLLCAGALALIGVVAVYSVTAPLEEDAVWSPRFLRHAVALIFGGLLAAVCARLSLRLWRALAWPLFALALALLAATLWTPLGVESHGALRWLRAPAAGVVFQPVEFAKLVFVLALARLLARNGGGGAVAVREYALAPRADLPPARLFAALLFTALPAGLCLLQRDFGSAFIMAALAGALLFLAGVRFRHLLLPLAAFGAAAAAYIAHKDYALRRITGFMDPWAQQQGDGYQLVQSFAAFGLGGWFGEGVGNGRLKFFYLPEAHNDFILAAIAEETGFAGVTLVLCAFAGLAFAGLRIAYLNGHPFARLAAAGMTLLLIIPALLNAGVVTGLLPTKGLTLPFISYGRSSLLASCMALGILLAALREARRAE